MTASSSAAPIDERTVDIGSLQLDGGTTLASVEQRVAIYGVPNADASNVVFVPHALTGSSRAADWWPGIVGAGALYDPQHWCVVGINALGGCYGSTGPSNRADFPRITVRDIVRAQRAALTQLGIKRLAVVIGGSLGGMQALQWAIDAPERVERAIVIGAHDHYSAMGIALNAIQRECLELDPVRGLRIARKLAMLTYKSDALLNDRHGRNPDRNDPARFDIEGYLDLQADRFESRMDAATYAILTHAMDSFDVRKEQPHRSNGTLPAAATPALPRITFVGISSDWLFRPQDVRAASIALANRGFVTRYLELPSIHGHDAFLAEPQALAALI
ncbi:MAG: homoserine O-acetyltransferase family protein [Vulcanimicrobiaceae bacterium]